MGLLGPDFRRMVPTQLHRSVIGRCARFFYTGPEARSCLIKRMHMPIVPNGEPVPLCADTGDRWFVGSIKNGGAMLGLGQSTTNAKPDIEPFLRESPILSAQGPAANIERCKRLILRSSSESHRVLLALKKIQDGFLQLFPESAELINLAIRLSNRANRSGPGCLRRDFTQSSIRHLFSYARTQAVRLEPGRGDTDHRPVELEKRRGHLRMPEYSKSIGIAASRALPMCLHHDVAIASLARITS